MIEELKETGKKAKAITEATIDITKEIANKHGIINTIGMLYLASGIATYASFHRDMREKFGWSFRETLIGGLPFTITTILFVLGLGLLIPHNPTTTSTCWKTHGPDYINYSGTCMPETAAAQHLAQLYPDTYQPVPTGELQSKTGLTGFGDLARIHAKAEKQGLIYCYHRNTGLLSREQYCKQAPATEAHQ